MGWFILAAGLSNLRLGNKPEDFRKAGNRRVCRTAVREIQAAGWQYLMRELISGLV